VLVPSGELLSDWSELFEVSTQVIGQRNALSALLSPLDYREAEQPLLDGHVGVGARARPDAAPPPARRRTGTTAQPSLAGHVAAVGDGCAKFACAH
jgi:hypothetical protein